MKKLTLKELLEKHKGKISRSNDTIKDKDSSPLNISFDPTKESSQENSFILLNSRKVRSIHQLCNEIGLAEEEVFNFHVTKHKNDFSHWIKNVFGYSKLAKAISDINNRDEFLRILGKLISENEKVKIPKKFKEIQYKKTILVDHEKGKRKNKSRHTRASSNDDSLRKKIDTLTVNNSKVMEQLNAIGLFLSKSHDVNSKRIDILERNINQLHQTVQDVKTSISEKLGKLVDDEEKKFVEMLKELKDIEEYEFEINGRMKHLEAIEKDIRHKESQIKNKELMIRKKKEKIANLSTR